MVKAVRWVRHATGIFLRTWRPGLTWKLVTLGEQGRAISYAMPVIVEVAGLLGITRDELVRYLGELIDDSALIVHLNEASEEARRALARSGIGGAVGGVQHGPLLYAIARWLRPQTAVETGVGAGLSSAYLLAATARTGQGTLCSIDLPEAASSDPAYLRLQLQMFGTLHPTRLPPGAAIGYAVPQSVRSRWQLIEGDARVELPRLLEQLGTIDLFLHDSMHTYEHMTFEYEMAYLHLRPGGLLVSDDVSWNSAFADFARRTGGRHSLLRGQLGILVKTRTT